MNLDEPALSEPLPGEAPETFVARLRLSQRALPALRHLATRSVALVVESDRRTSPATSLNSDFVLELGDTRLRLMLLPGEPAPFDSGAVTRLALAHYMLDVPDTDAIAVTADDDRLSTWVFDVYSLHAEHISDSAPLLDALKEYFESSVRPIQIPNLRGVLTLPSSEQLEAALSNQAKTAFERVRSGRARIDEKVTALGRIGPDDSRRLVELLERALRGEDTTLSMLLLDEADEDDD